MISFELSGRMSTFGGPHDLGVKPDEGLALIERVDLREWWFARLFLDYQPDLTTGLARRLNPLALYIAMRWPNAGIPREVARRAIFRLVNPINGKIVFAQGADEGPAAWTKRVADISPGAAHYLGLKTDDEIAVQMITG